MPLDARCIRANAQKFEINRTKIKASCQSGRKVVTHNSKSVLPLIHIPIFLNDIPFFDPSWNLCRI